MRARDDPGVTHRAGVLDPVWTQTARAFVACRSVLCTAPLPFERQGAPSVQPLSQLRDLLSFFHVAHHFHDRVRIDPQGVVGLSAATHLHWIAFYRSEL